MEVSGENERGRPRPRHVALSWAVANIAAASVVITSASLAQTTGPVNLAPTPQLSCVTGEYRQFDFWVGKWDVFNTKDNKPAGSSVIESLYAGCALRENWSEPGFSGGSLNAYNAADKNWHQTWTDAAGAWREFVGGMEGEKMVLIWRHASVRNPSKTVQVRMTFTPNPDGSVRQYSDQSIDGVQWVERYDYTYRHARP